MQLRTPQQALDLLTQLGASPHLLQHHRLVAEAAAELTAGLSAYLSADASMFATLGAALHDAGKIVHPEEMQGPGHQHEAAGRALLERRGIGALARVCVTHAAWQTPGLGLPDLLVALADKLWKGKRVAELERRVVARLAESAGQSFWSVFPEVERLFERIAAQADGRLARSASFAP